VSPFIEPGSFSAEAEIDIADLARAGAKLDGTPAGARIERAGARELIEGSASAARREVPAPIG